MRVAPENLETPEGTHCVFCKLNGSTENTDCATRCIQRYYPAWMMEHEFRDGSECHGETSYFRRGKKSRNLWGRE